MNLIEASELIEALRSGATCLVGAREFDEVDREVFLAAPQRYALVTAHRGVVRFYVEREWLREQAAKFSPVRGKQ